MSQRHDIDLKISSATGTRSNLPSSNSYVRQRNVCQLLAWREISPQSKHCKKVWEERSKVKGHHVKLRFETKDAKHALISWVEAESLCHLSAKYCPFLPPPRSTIAAAFSVNGKTLASTHGDHTVKIIDCNTGNCLKVLCGHRRTPWVVRFHPLYSEILASGSLDHEVRIWDAKTGDCIGSREFGRPIASIAFHAQGELLAVASGHKLYIWNYNRRGDGSSPSIILKTRRSLRAVHFHPHGGPFLLTAEVNDLDSPDSPLTSATSSGYLHYPPPAIFFANNGDKGGIFLGERQRAESFHVDVENQQDKLAVPMDIVPGEPSGSDTMPANAVSSSLLAGIGAAEFYPVVRNAEASEGESSTASRARNSHGIVERFDSSNNVPSSVTQNNGIPMRFASARHLRAGVDTYPTMNSSSSSVGADFEMILRSLDGGLHQFIPFHDPSYWELPFLRGWLMAQSQAGLRPTGHSNSTVQGSSAFIHATESELLTPELLEPLLASSSMANVGSPRVIGRSSSRHRSRSRLMTYTDVGDATAFQSTFQSTSVDEAVSHPRPRTMEAEIPPSLAAAAAAELPCTVKLRIWPYNIRDPCAPLDKCCLTIHHAVLCSEMGAHFSPCGRFLVACVACVLPHMEGETGLQSHMHHDATDVATSPTRHPITAHQVTYELRIYSLEEETFGEVLSSRAIRAAHCLTSIQFSPTSEHILLAYGRRHNSLLRSIVVDGETAILVYTILEIYRVSDMELVRVLPSAEDEVNVACFHPTAGGGIVYGTKEGKLRILQFDGSQEMSCMGPNYLLEENMLEIQKYALEC